MIGRWFRWVGWVGKLVGKWDLVLDLYSTRRGKMD